MDMKLKVKVRPSVFKWMRETSGYTAKEIASMLNVDTAYIKSIEDSREEYVEIPLKHLHLLARKYKRQLACFFLSRVPEGESLEDINSKYTIPIKVGQHYSHKVLLADRLCRYYRCLIKDYGYNETRPEPSRYTLQHEPEVVADKELHVLLGDYGMVRCSIEQYCINVLEGNIQLVLADERPYMIMVTATSSISKLEQLVEGYAHILLRHSSYCFFIDEYEAWCKDFMHYVMNKKKRLDKYVKRYGLAYLKALMNTDLRDDEIAIDVIDVKVDDAKTLRIALRT